MTVWTSPRIRRAGIVSPFRERFTAFGMSGGASQVGYDLCVSLKGGHEWMDGSSKIQHRKVDGVKVDALLLHASNTQLITVQERLKMPTNAIGRICDKSSQARRGVRVGNTVIEPGWEGYLTLELTYTPVSILNRAFWDARKGEVEVYDALIFEGMPIAQLLIEEIDDACTYTGKYNNQPQTPIGFRRD